MISMIGGIVLLLHHRHHEVPRRSHNLPKQEHLKVDSSRFQNALLSSGLQNRLNHMEDTRLLQVGLGLRRIGVSINRASGNSIPT
jgi:hypothetical protein